MRANRCCLCVTESDETTEQQVLAAAGDRSSAWVTLETSREGHHWLPWRPNYDVGESSIEDCEDPERVIVFDDLSVALFSVQSSRERFQLLCRFLDFITACLPPSCLEQTMEERRTDSSLWWKVSEAFPDEDSSSAFSDVKLAQSELNKICAFVENVYSSTIGLFEGELRTALTMRYANFKTVALLSPNNLSDRRERKRAEKTVRQFFKSLLKQEHNRGNLAVWERYARFEWEIGNFDDARRVFEIALSMAGSAIDTSSGDSEFPVVRLYSTYSRLELGIDELSTSIVHSTKKSDRDHSEKIRRACRILVMAVSGYQANSTGAEISAAEIVRARNCYQHHLNVMSAALTPSDTEQIKRCGQNLLDWTTCFALFQLITVGLTPASSVLHNFRTNVRRLSETATTTVGVSLDTQNIADDPVLDSSNVPVCRALLQSAAKLHVQLSQFHMRIGAVPLSVVRAALSEALAEFPDDVWFLKTFVDSELSSHISGRLREYFHLAVSRAISPMPVLYAVLAERKRWLRLSAECQMPCKSNGCTLCFISLLG